MMAAQMAMGRERFRYQCYLYGLAFTFLPIIAIIKKNPQVCFPLFPFSAIIGFQYDMLYGNMQVRIQKEATRLMKEEPERFYMPQGNGIVTR